MLKFVIFQYIFKVLIQLFHNFFNRTHTLRRILLLLTTITISKIGILMLTPFNITIYITNTFLRFYIILKTTLSLQAYNISSILPKLLFNFLFK